MNASLMGAARPPASTTSVMASDPALRHSVASTPKPRRSNAPAPSASDRGADRHAGVARIAEAAKATIRAAGPARCADAASEQTFRRAGAALGGHAANFACLPDPLDRPPPTA